MKACDKSLAGHPSHVLTKNFCMYIKEDYNHNTW